jgi:predicted dehydrogenase
MPTGNSNPTVAVQPELNRRSFVKTAAAVTAAAAAVTSTGPLVRTAKAAGEKVQYGFIGPGSRGGRLLERHLQHIPSGECVAICDIYQPNLDKAMDIFRGKPDGTPPKPYTDYNALLADPNVEAVFITVPLFMHYPIMKAALEAGKHVFCEKSLVFTPAEVHGLRALHEAHPDLVIQVGLQRRYSEFYHAAKKLIDDGAIGKITHIQAQWHRNGNWRRTATPEMEEQINWRMYREYSGGLCAELMSHQVDVADWFMGSRPQSVVGVGGIDYWKDGRTVFDNVQLIFEYPGGEKLQYSSITTNRHAQGRRGPGDGCRELILGTDGAIEISLIPNGDGMLYLDRMPLHMGDDEQGGETWTAGATVASDTLEQGEGLAIIPNAVDADSGEVGFIAKEVEYAKRWMYRKGILSPSASVHEEYGELESFLDCVLTGAKPNSDIEVGLQDSVAVMLSNLAMDQERKIYFSEIEAMGLDGVQMTQARSGAPVA